MKQMRYGYCIFCDDVRTEIGEKLSFIGVYSGVLTLPDFPVSLPKFCAHVNLITLATEPYRSIVLRCVGPGDRQPLLEERLESSQLEEQRDLSSDVERGGVPINIVIGASLIFSPLRLRQPGLLTISAIIDDRPAEIASLRVVQR
ncbi:hypothetical protein HGP17_28460 [Rhizobium sp. P38BS-XIX]|uniref:DUF6941 family protein n=1 Tax=Rhizobium sp. P38BS-XIX TaxID=2726740 RepID=UPI0014575BBA|nr:hypothetical protein [Rhizobium sp. P38BS-XIX]NLS00780.1 hypothetical protein [Rhizobium sp. P38BS-XIX]